jgi:hypothetical protein
MLMQAVGAPIMTNMFTLESTFPPSLADNPLLAMITVMAFWAIVLICLRWIYEGIDAHREFPAPVGSYIRTSRRMRMWLVASALLAAAPRLAQLMLWQLLSPPVREMVSSITWLAIIPAAAMVIYAWWLHNGIARTEQTYVKSYGFLFVDKADRQEKSKGALIVGLIFVIAFATTFVRPQPDAHSTPLVERRG